MEAMWSHMQTAQITKSPRTSDGLLSDVGSIYCPAEYVYKTKKKFDSVFFNWGQPTLRLYHVEYREVPI